MGGTLQQGRASDAEHSGERASRSQRGRPVSLGGSAGVGGSWSDARLRDEQFDAAQDQQERHV